MTRDEQIIEASHNYGKTINEEVAFDYEDMKCAFKEGAKWADEHPNLESIWHDAGEIPKENTWVLAEFNEMNYETFFMCPLGGASSCKDVNLTRWAYISDLLPKGGKK